MDQCWKNLAERMEEEVVDKNKVEESKKEAFLGWRRVRKSRKILNKKVESRLLGKNLRLVQRMPPASAKQAGGANGRGRDEAAAKNGDHERSDKENSIKRKNGR